MLEKLFKKCIVQKNPFGNNASKLRHSFTDLTCLSETVGKVMFHSKFQYFLCLCVGHSEILVYIRVTKFELILEWTIVILCRFIRHLDRDIWCVSGSVIQYLCVSMHHLLGILTDIGDNRKIIIIIGVNIGYPTGSYTVSSDTKNH